ncbi:hypothetical protein EMCRGX_G002469 [Ephydatia muelleri]
MYIYVFSATVQHAQITVCMVHVYDLCSVCNLLDRSSSHARRHCTPVGMGVISAAPACPGTSCTLQSLSLCSIFLCSYPSLPPSFLSLLSLPPSLSPSPLPPSLPLSCPPVVMYMYTSRDISGKITHTIYPPCTDLLES